MTMSVNGTAGSDLNDNVGKIYAIYICAVCAIAIIVTILEHLGLAAASTGQAFAAVTIAIYLLVSYQARARTSLDFLLAGRSLPAASNGLSLAGGWIGTAGLLSVTGALYSLGQDGLAPLAGLISGLALISILIAPYLRKLGASTLPGFFAARYGAGAGLIAALITTVISLLLLVTLLGATASFAKDAFEIPYLWALGAAAIIVSAPVLLGGMKGVSWTSAAQYLVLLITLQIITALASAHMLGWSLPQLGYGEALSKIATLEIGMIEKGVASADTLKPHIAPFLQIGPLNTVAIVFTLMLGTAAMPQLLMRAVSTPSASNVRLSVAWACFFALCLAITLPAIAALSKLQTFTLIEKGTPLADLPSWIETHSAKDRVRIHGVSLAMMNDVGAAVRSGAADTGALANHLKLHTPQTAAAFANLEPSVKGALLNAAKAAGPSSWDALRTTVLPAAAKAAGNTTGMLTEDGLWIDPAAVYLVLSDQAGVASLLGGLAGGLIIAGVLAAMLGAASGAMLTASTSLGHDIYYKLLDRNAPEGRHLMVLRLFIILCGGAAAYLAYDGHLSSSFHLRELAGGIFALAASGLFPALVLGIWWKRANVWGAAAGMMAGSAVCLYYIAGQQIFPVGFYDAWPNLSSAGEFEIGMLENLRSAWSSAADDTARNAAWVALEAFTRGSASTTGLANWFGVPASAAALFAMPVGLVCVILVSLITPKPRPEITSLIEEMRRPRGAEIISGT